MTADWIENAVAIIAQKEQELINLKKAVNQFCQSMGLEPRYAAADLAPANSVGGVIRADQYYGKNLATAVKEYLESRRMALPAEEILEALAKGGFDFESIGWKDEFRLRSLSMSLAKNTKAFVRLPNNTWGLPGFYENLPKIREKAKTSDKGADATAGAEDSSEQPENVEGGEAV